MNPVTVAYFRTLFPEFTKISDAALEIWISIVVTRVPASVWGTNTTYGQALLLAHMLTASGKAGLGSGGGAVTAESVGDLSRSFATLGEGTGDQELLTTRYGQDFVALRRETVVVGTVTGPNTFPPGGFCGW